MLQKNNIAFIKISEPTSQVNYLPVHCIGLAKYYSCQIFQIL